MRTDEEIFAILNEIAENAPPLTTPQRRRGSNPAGPASPMIQSLPKPGPKRLSGSEFTKAFNELWKARTDKNRRRARLWAVSSFLHAEHSRSGKGLNHEIEGFEGNEALFERLLESAKKMERKKMTSVFLADVLQAFNGHDINDCESLANRLHRRMILEETIPGLRESDVLRSFGGIWTLSAIKTHPIRQELRKVGMLAVA